MRIHLMFSCLIYIFSLLGEEYLPFAEIPSLRNMVLTGDEIDDSPFLALREGEGRIPESRAITGNDAPVNFGQRSSGSNFRPTYD
jgi:hypothetical protein